MWIPRARVLPNPGRKPQAPSQSTVALGLKLKYTVPKVFFAVLLEEPSVFSKSGRKAITK